MNKVNCLLPLKIFHNKTKVFGNTLSLGPLLTEHTERESGEIDMKIENQYRIDYTIPANIWKSEIRTLSSLL